jgi:hypothetical protein
VALHENERGLCKQLARILNTFCVLLFEWRARHLPLPRRECSGFSHVFNRRSRMAPRAHVFLLDVAIRVTCTTFYFVLCVILLPRVGSACAVPGTSGRSRRRHTTRTSKHFSHLDQIVASPRATARRLVVQSQPLRAESAAASDSLNPAQWALTIRAAISLGQGFPLAYLMYRPDSACNPALIRQRSRQEPAHASRKLR